MSIVYFLKASKFLAEIECFYYLTPGSHLDSHTGGVMLGYLDNLSEFELTRWIVGLAQDVVQMLGGPPPPSYHYTPAKEIRKLCMFIIQKA